MLILSYLGDATHQHSQKCIITESQEEPTSSGFGINRMMALNFYPSCHFGSQLVAFYRWYSLLERCCRFIYRVFDAWIEMYIMCMWFACPNDWLLRCSLYILQLANNLTCKLVSMIKTRDIVICSLRLWRDEPLFSRQNGGSAWWGGLSSLRARR